jgi:hypothetical protein
MNDKQKLLGYLDEATRAGDVELSEALLSQLKALDQGAQPQAAPVDQAAQVYDDVPSVPTQDLASLNQQVPAQQAEVPASMDTQPIAPNPEINPADNLADQTTNNRAWLGKITDALWPGSQGMSMGDYVSTAGGRYKNPLEAMKEAEIYPGTTIPGLLKQEFDEGTQKFGHVGSSVGAPTLEEWGQIVTTPEFMSNVGTIAGPMLYNKFKNDLAFFKKAPAGIKDAVLMTLIGGVATMFGGSVSDILNRTPSKMGEFDFSTVGKSFFPDLTTQAGRFQQGAVWTAAPEAVMQGLGKYVGGPAARWALSIKDQWKANIAKQIKAGEDLSMDTPQNVRNIAEWKDMSLGRQLLPKWAGGPKPLEVGPYGRQRAGEVGTELYIGSGGVIPTAAQAFGALPMAGAAIRKQAVHHSKTAIENMRSKLDLMGRDLETDTLGRVVTYAARRWGKDQLDNVATLYNKVDELAAAMPGLGPTTVGQQADFVAGVSKPGHIVPTNRIKQATQEVYDDVMNIPKDRITDEPLELFLGVQKDAERWLTQMERLGPNATLAQVRNLRRLVSQDLEKLGDGEYAKFALQRYKNAMTDAIHVDSVAALKAQGTPEYNAVANALQLANLTYKTFKDFTRSTAGQQFELVNPKFWKAATLEGKLVQNGSENADQMFGLAFNTGMRSPQYLRDMREIMGEKTFNTAAGNYLRNAMDKAFKSGELQATSGMVQTLQSPGYQMGKLEGMKTPAKFSEDAFRTALGLGRGGPFKSAGSGALKELFKLTGSKVTVQNVDSLMTILARYPINMDLATMAARRIPLAGSKGALSVVSGGLARGAAGVGGVAAGGAVMGTMGGALAMMLVLNQFGRVLSNPNALKSLVKLGNTMSAAEKAGRTVGKHSQRAMFVKLFVDLGFDHKDSNGAFNTLHGVARDLKPEIDYKIMQGRQAIEGVTGLEL